MKKLKFAFVSLTLITIVFQACKEDEINPQDFVRRHFIGKWPLKTRLEKTYKNNIIIRDTAISYVPIDTLSPKMDTLLFTTEGKYTKKGVTVNYSIDATGDNITYSTTPASTWKINFLRNKSIILSQERTEKIGNDTFRYYVEEQLIK